MITRFIYKKSAFKHKFKEADILWAFQTARYDELMELDEHDVHINDKRLLLGYDTRGNPLEVMYNRLEDDTVNVFHAMKCRDEWLPYYKRGDGVPAIAGS